MEHGACSRSELTRRVRAQLTGEQTVEVCGYAVNAAWPELRRTLRQAGLRLVQTHYGSEAYLDGTVPRARRNSVLVLDGVPTLNGQRLRAIRVRGQWWRPPGQEHLTLSPGQWVAQTCSCGRVARLALSDGSLHCRGCLPAELDARLTALVGVSRLTDRAPSRQRLCLHPGLALLAGHELLSVHGFRGRTQSQQDGLPSSRQQALELCRQVLDGTRTLSADELVQVDQRPAEMQQWLDGRQGSMFEQSRSLLEHGLVTDAKLGSLLWCQDQMLGEQRTARLGGAVRDAGHLGTVGERVELEVWIDHLQHCEGNYGPQMLVSALSDQAHLLRWYVPAGAALKSDERYRLRATIKNHRRWREQSVTDLQRVKLLAGPL